MFIDFSRKCFRLSIFIKLVYSNKENYFSHMKTRNLYGNIGINSYVRDEVSAIFEGHLFN